MSRMDFEKFLDTQNAGDKIDWQAKRDEWLKSVEGFYRQIEEFLKPYTRAKKLAIEYKTKRMHETYIGDYEIQSAMIHIGRQTINLDPIGTNVIGARGRIDLVGPKGIVRFVLVDRDQTELRLEPQKRKLTDVKLKKVEYEWRIVVELPQRRLSYLALTVESFLDCLMGTANG